MPFAHHAGRDATAAAGVGGGGEAGGGLGLRHGEHVVRARHVGHAAGGGLLVRAASRFGLGLGLGSGLGLGLGLRLGLGLGLALTLAALGLRLGFRQD